MEALDLKKFLWQHKTSKEAFVIIAITDYKSDDVVVYREFKDRGKIEVTSVDEFCRDFEATYEVP